MNSPELKRNSGLYAAFVGPNSDYYIQQWERSPGRWRSWNWSAFFFGDGWLLYRKLYGYAVIFALVRLLITLLTSSLEPFHDDLLNSLVSMVMPYSILINIFVGLYGNGLYQRQADKKIALARAAYPPLTWLMELSKLGGVSWVALLLIPVFSVIENLVLAIYQQGWEFDWFQLTQGIRL
jgi:hypothetical protein